jgi:hypothetical protein
VAVVASVVLGAVTATGCGASRAKVSASTVAPVPLLRRSRAVVDAARSIHFVLTSSGVSPSGTAILGGTGDLVRPDELRGTFSIQVSGLNASVGVVETGGRFYAEPPFASHYSITNPATYGLGDPAQLLSPTTGVSVLLTSLDDLRATGDERIAGELVESVTGTVPGRSIPVLPDLAPARPVRITAEVDPTSAELRLVTLEGPFTSATTDTTYTVALSDYGEHVTVTAPQT